MGPGEEQGPRRCARVAGPARLGGDVPVGEAKHLLLVAMLCVQDHSVERRTMRDVLQMPHQVSSYTSTSYIHHSLMPRAC